MASNTIVDLLVKLGIDTKEFESGLDKAEGKAKSSGSNIAAGLAAVGKVTVAAGIAAITAGVVGLASTIGPASDLNETVSKVGVVFGESADEVLAFGDTAAKALGMSKNAALGAAGTYGNLFRAMGMTEDTSADMSTGLVQLAGDLASFNNMDPTQVLDALRSGLSGETEPLKRLGVNLNQAVLEQKALTMGLWSGKGALDASAKAQATYALIMEQTALAQGDFARTSDGLANQQRIMAANFENIKGTIGTALLPAITALSQTLLNELAKPETIAFIQNLTTGLAAFAQNVIAWIPQVVQWFTNLGAWFTNNQGVLVGILAALTVAVVAFAVSSAVALWGMMAPLLPIIAIMAAVAAVAYLVYQAWTTNFLGIQETVATNLAVVQQILDVFSLAFQGKWFEFGQALRKIWDELWGAIKTAAINAWAGLSTAFNTLKSNIVNFFANADWAEIGENILKGIAEGIANTVEAVIEAAVAAGEAIWDALRGFFGIESPSKLFASVGQNLMLGLAQGVDAFAGVPVDVSVKAAESVNQAVSGQAGAGSVQSSTTYTGPSAAEIGRETALAFMQLGLAR